MKIAFLGNINSGMHLMAEKLANDNSLTLANSNILKYADDQDRSFISENNNLEDLKTMDNIVVYSTYDNFIPEETNDIIAEINSSFEVHVMKRSLEDLFLDVLIDREIKVNQNSVSKEFMAISQDLNAFQVDENTLNACTTHFGDIFSIFEKFTISQSHDISELYTEQELTDYRNWQRSIIINVSDVDNFLTNSLAPIVQNNSNVSIFS